MRIYDENGEIVAIFYSVKRKGDNLVVDAKVLESLRMDIFMRPRDILSGLKMVLTWQVVFFILLLPYFGIKHLFRKSKE